MARKDQITVIGAREHNLKNIDINIPKNKLVVITGISGSGKSSLAFDTIFAEGQRRYMETFSAYARQFLGHMDRPDVEKIDGLHRMEWNGMEWNGMEWNGMEWNGMEWNGMEWNGMEWNQHHGKDLEQKTSGWNPRSTVGTTTEIYDFLRLLYARIGEAYSYETGKRMIKYSEEKIILKVLEQFQNKKVLLLAPLIRGRKGHYRELFDQIRKKGYTKVRVDGQIMDLVPKLQVDRYKTHDIELVVDRIKIDPEKRDRIAASIQMALETGNDLIFIQDADSGFVHTFSKQLMCPDSGISYEEPSPNSFSFNSPYGACPHCKGLGKLNQVDMAKVIPDDTKSINEGGIVPFGDVRDNTTFKQLRKIAKKYNFSFATPVNDIPELAMDLILNGGEGMPYQENNYAKHDFIYNLAENGLINMLEKWYKDSSSEKIRNWAEDFMTIITCPECNGYRIKKDSRYFKLGNKHIGELAKMDLSDLKIWFESLPDKLDEKQWAIAKDILKEIQMRLGFLVKVGLEYLSLDRSSRTLSGGESQRTRLATQIGSQLSGITYILDEPSIGLHQRDNHRLIDSLKNLTRIGNTVLVVEHDKDIMLASDYLIDLGPGAGELGGEIVGEGTPENFIKNGSPTALYLNNSKRIEVPAERRKGNGQFLILKGSSGNNLQDIDLSIPLGTFTCVTGVSGSGKSSLINQTLYPILRHHFYKSTQKPLSYKSISGIEHIDKIIEIDQSPIGRTPRSNPATYTGVFTDIRKLFSDIPESKIRGYKPGRFSFNVKGGRCETCQGGGKRLIEMNFLPDVYIDCETCMGKRYNRETLEVLYKGKSISDVLQMNITEANKFFENIPSIYRKLKTLKEVGLGYVALGQQATTLSGGEAQRVKLAEELSKRDTGNTLYILDEPTTGLHFQDIQYLLEVLNSLVEKGNTVIVIEHNLDVVKVADHIIDLGPDGGKNGGKLIFEGTPEEIAAFPDSYTGQFLKSEL